MTRRYLRWLIAFALENIIDFLGVDPMTFNDISASGTSSYCVGLKLMLRGVGATSHRCRMADAASS